MAQFYAWLGEKKSRRIKLALMDMWKPFRKAEYARLSGKDRRFIKGQKYTLLSNRENLSLEGKKALKALLSANKRLNTAYLLKESFGQLWDYQREGWARRFFDNWRAVLKWQRLEPYRKFAEMIDRHWDGIAVYCHPENKVSLGFVEGLNNKIRLLQRRAYGLRDEEYLRLHYRKGRGVREFQYIDDACPDGRDGGDAGDAGRLRRAGRSDADVCPRERGAAQRQWLDLHLHGG